MPGIKREEAPNGCLNCTQRRKIINDRVLICAYRNSPVAYDDCMTCEGFVLSTCIKSNDAVSTPKEVKKTLVKKTKLF